MPVDVADDYYALLGVAPEADDATIRQAWRQLALRWHPDRAGEGATATFQKISAAYTVLSQPGARALYNLRRPRDARSTQPPPPPTPGRAPGLMLSRLSGGLNGLLACGFARYAEAGVIDLFLNAAEVEQGGMISIAMRVPVHCGACTAATVSSCRVCSGAGVVEDVFSAWLAVRPGVADHALLTPSAQLPGMLRPVLFRVRRLAM